MLNNKYGIHLQNISEEQSAITHVFTMLGLCYKLSLDDRDSVMVEIGNGHYYMHTNVVDISSPYIMTTFNTNTSNNIILNIDCDTNE